MVTNMVTTYKELTIRQYLQIKGICRECDNNLEIQARLIAILSGMNMDEVWALPLPEYQKMARQTAFLLNESKPKARCPKEVVIDGVVCGIETRVAKLTASQYIDYVNLSKKNDDHLLPNILACFIVPKGKTYGKDYDIDALAEKIADTLDMDTTLGICFFFRKKYRSLISSLLTYLKWTMKTKGMTKEEKSALMEKVTSLENGITYVW